MRRFENMASKMLEKNMRQLTRRKSFLLLHYTFFSRTKDIHKNHFTDLFEKKMGLVALQYLWSKLKFRRMSWKNIKIG